MEEKNSKLNTYLKDRLEGIKKMTGKKVFTYRVKHRFYEYMTDLYRRLERECEELERIKAALCEYRDTEYALSEVIGLHDYLHKRSSAALSRILNRQHTRGILERQLSKIKWQSTKG